MAAMVAVDCRWSMSLCQDLNKKLEWGSNLTRKIPPRLHAPVPMSCVARGMKTLRFALLQQLQPDVCSLGCVLGCMAANIGATEDLSCHRRCSVQRQAAQTSLTGQGSG